MRSITISLGSAGNLGAWDQSCPLATVCSGSQSTAVGNNFGPHVCSWPIFNVAQFSYRLTLIPDEFQGCVHSAYRLRASDSQPSDR